MLGCFNLIFMNSLEKVLCSKPKCKEKKRDKCKRSYES